MIRTYAQGVRTALEDLLRKRDERPIFPAISGHIAELCSLQLPKICSRSPTSSLRPPMWYTLLVAAVLVGLLVSAPQTQAQRLGRLFTTPEQRSALDEVRLQAQFAEPPLEFDPEPVAMVSTVAAEPDDPVVSKLIVNGIVRRSGGPTSVWVNGDEVERGATTREGVAVEAARMKTDVIRLRLPSGTQSIALRPGQEIDVRSGLVLEAYEKGSGSADARSAFDSRSSAVVVAPDAQQQPMTGNRANAAGIAPLSTGSQQSAAGGTMVEGPSISDQLRAIAELPPEQQREALARLAATNARSAAPAQ